MFFEWTGCLLWRNSALLMAPFCFSLSNSSSTWKAAAKGKGILVKQCSRSCRVLLQQPQVKQDAELEEMLWLSGG